MVNPRKWFPLGNAEEEEEEVYLGNVEQEEEEEEEILRRTHCIFHIPTDRLCVLRAKRSARKGRGGGREGGGRGGGRPGIEPCFCRGAFPRQSQPVTHKLVF